MFIRANMCESHLHVLSFLLLECKELITNLLQGLVLHLLAQSAMLLQRPFTPFAQVTGCRISWKLLYKGENGGGA